MPARATTFCLGELVLAVAAATEEYNVHLRQTAAVTSHNGQSSNDKKKGEEVEENRNSSRSNNTKSKAHGREITNLHLLPSGAVRVVATFISAVHVAASQLLTLLLLLSLVLLLLVVVWLLGCCSLGPLSPCGGPPAAAAA